MAPQRGIEHTSAFAPATELLLRAATSAPFEGRPMYAALRAIPIPDDVWQRLVDGAAALGITDL